MPKTGRERKALRREKKIPSLIVKIWEKVLVQKLKNLLPSKFCGALKKDSKNKRRKIQRGYRVPAEAGDRITIQFAKWESGTGSRNSLGYDSISQR